MRPNPASKGARSSTFTWSAGERSVGSEAHERPASDTSALLTLPRRRSIFQDGKPVTAYYEVVEGDVLIYRHVSKLRRQVFRVARAGAWIGATVGSTYLHTAETLTICKLRKRQRAEVESSPDLSKRLHEQIEYELELIQDLAVLLGRRTALERVAAFLLDLHPVLRLASPAAAAEVKVSTSLRRRDIGDYLGLNVETISRNIALLKRNGIISTGKRGEFKLIDPAALQGILEADTMLGLLDVLPRAG